MVEVSKVCGWFSKNGIKSYRIIHHIRQLIEYNVEELDGEQNCQDYCSQKELDPFVFEK